MAAGSFRLMFSQNHTKEKQGVFLPALVRKKSEVTGLGYVVIPRPITVTPEWSPMITSSPGLLSLAIMSFVSDDREEKEYLADKQP